MYKWLVTYIPFGNTCMTETTTVVGDTVLQAQEYFSKYYVGKIISIRQQTIRRY